MPRFELNQAGSPIRHQTISRVISGSVLIQVDGKTLLIDNMTEPSEDSLGPADKVEVLHLERPLEWVAPAYDGGTVMLTLVEEQTKGRRSPYRAAGFKDATEFVDIINHQTFSIVIILYNADGSQTVQKLHNCRVIAPITPNGGYSRGTLRRTLSAQVGYTHRTTSGDL